MKYKYLITGTIFICVLELLAYIIGTPFSYLAGRIWIVWGCIFIFFSFNALLKTILIDLKLNYFEGIAGLLLTLIVISIGLFSEFSIHHETTQQIASTITQFTNHQDLGYTKTVFLGYPSRQFWFLVFPTLIFGQSPLNLTIGYAFFFFLGVGIFYSGLRSLIPAKTHIPLIGIALISIFTFPYVIEFLWNFEQSILPLSFFLASLGWLMIFLKRQSFGNFLSLAWISGLLGTSYTPSLAAWIFMLCSILIVLIFQKNIDKKIYLFLLVIIIFIFGSCSFLSRQDIRIFSNSTHSIIFQETFATVINSFKILFFSKDKQFIAPILSSILIPYIILSLLLRFGKIHFLLNLWVLFTVIAAVTFSGYASPPYEFSLHRALVIIPPLLAGSLIFLIIEMNKRKIHISHYNYLIIMSLFIAFSVWNISYFSSTRIMKQSAVLIHNMISITNKTHIHTNDRFIIGILSKNIEFVSISDYLQYFFPKHSSYYSDGKCIIPNTRLPILLYGDLDNECFQKIADKLKQEPEIISYKILDSIYEKKRLLYIPKNL